MTDIAIVDSSGLVSLINTDDSLHSDALKISAKLDAANTNLVLPYEVLAETLNIIGKKISNAAAISAGRAILEGGFVLPVTPSNFPSQVIARLEQQKASVSYIDCLVMQWAEHYHTTAIFGFDAVFVANGFRLPTN